jgi:hypothetical protein
LAFFLLCCYFVNDRPITFVAAVNGAGGGEYCVPNPTFAVNAHVSIPHVDALAWYPAEKAVPFLLNEPDK